MNTFFTALSLVLPMAFIAAFVVVIVTLATRSQREDTEGAGVATRRFFQYGSMLVALLLAGLGVAGLVDTATSSRAAIASGNTSTALWISFIVVGFPVLAGLSLLTWRRLTDGDLERRSLGWAFYLTTVLWFTLTAVAALTVDFFTEWSESSHVDSTLIIHIAVWSSVWVAHWLINQRWGHPHNMRIHLLLGSATGLIILLSGIHSLLEAVFFQIYDTAASLVTVNRFSDDFVAAVIPLVVGGAVWWWYWVSRAERGPRTPWWNAYLLIIGVLVGAVTALAAAGSIVFSLLDWFIGDRGFASASSHFDSLPTAIAAALVGAASWGYHTMVLWRGDHSTRSSADRIHDYLLSAVGLGLSASGGATVVSFILGSVGGTVVRGADSTMSVAITLLAIGLPLWIWYWLRISHHTASNPEVELVSQTRKIYLSVAMGSAAVLAVGSLIFIVFMSLEDLLDGAFGSSTIRGIRVPIGLFVTSGAVAWYHIGLFRSDREFEEETVQPDIFEAGAVKVTIVGADAPTVSRAITNALGDRAEVTSLTTGSSGPVSLEQLMTNLAGMDSADLLITQVAEDGYVVTTLDDNLDEHS